MRKIFAIIMVLCVIAVGYSSVASAEECSHLNKVAKTFVIENYVGVDSAYCYTDVAIVINKCEDCGEIWLAETATVKQQHEYNSWGKCVKCGDMTQLFGCIFCIAFIGGFIAVLHKLISAV